MEVLKDYRITGKISETSKVRIYNGQKNGESKAVLIHVLNKHNLFLLPIERFKREYIAVNNIGIDTVLKTHDILDTNDKLFLITEDFNGINPYDFFSNRFDMETFLNFSINLAETIGELHKNNIIHKNLRPENILLKSDSIFKIFHFDTWTELTGEKELLNGRGYTYTSPEQTGRIESLVDYRTDFYSMGILLYEIVTGSVPFKSKDPMKMIHSHIAEIPVAPSIVNSDIPTVVSNIIMKLLEKSADERYQNAIGLAIDLKKSLNQYKNNSTEIFELAENDVSMKFKAPQKLFGRKEELNFLKKTYERALSGRAELLFIKGNAGVGKTSLIKEAQKHVIVNNGYFIFGKYEKNHREMPYSAIIQAFKALIKQILTESDDRVVILKGKLLSELGNNCRVITDIIPEFTLIIGEQPELSILPPMETMNRFYYVCKKFMEIVANAEHPVVLFLDDIQWADTSSLELLHQLTTRRGVKYFCLFCAFRENEISSNHPINQAIRSIEKIRKSVNTLHLNPLNKETVQTLIEHLLKQSHSEISTLTNIIYNKTTGNPFFVIELLRTLYNEKAIELNSSGNWQWEVDKISMITETGNVSQLLQHNIKKLPDNVKNLLKISACVSGFFDLEFLTHILDQPIDKTIGELSIAIDEGLLCQLKEKKSGNNIYHYNHDHLEESVYSLIPKDDKAFYHYKIGRFALENRMEHDSQNKLFYIVDQLNMGSGLIKDPAEKIELCRLNYEAGVKAKETAAYLHAIHYFKISKGLLEENCWEDQYELTLLIYTDLSKAMCMTGEIEAIGELAETAENKVRSFADLEGIYISKIDACAAKNELGKAVDIGVKFLNMIEKPLKVSKFRVVAYLLRLRLYLKKNKTEELLTAEPMIEPGIRAAMHIGLAMGHVCYHINPDMLAMIMLRNVFWLKKYGFDSTFPTHLIALGLFRVQVMGDIEGADYYGKIALKAVELPESQKYKSMCVFIYNFSILHWKAHVKETLGAFMKGYKHGIKNGDLVYSAYNLTAYFSYHLKSGTNLVKLEQMISDYHETFKQLNQPNLMTLHKITHQVVLNLLDKNSSPTDLNGLFLNEGKLLKDWNDKENKVELSWYYHSKLYLSVLFKDYDGAKSLCSKAKKYIYMVKTTSLYPSFIVTESLILLHSCKKEYNRAEIKLVKRNLKLLKKWTGFCKENFQQYYYMVQAEYNNVIKNQEAAEKFFDLAIMASKKNGFIQVEALANELAAQFYFSYEKHAEAEKYINNACQCYSKWGAIAKLKQLEKEFSHVIISQYSEKKENAEYGITEDVTQALDFSSVMKASRVISSEIELGKFLTGMMKITIENAGAQHGVMILNNAGKLFIEAEKVPGVDEIRILDSVPFENYENLSHSIVQYVARTKETVVLNNASGEGDFIQAPYVIENKPKSLLCCPIMNHGELSGILYLENNLSTGAFTTKRLEILNVLSAQIAISINNVRFYENLEGKVKERTIELRETMGELEYEIERRTEVEEKLRLSYHRLTRVLDYTEDAIVVLNQRYEIVFFNQSSEKMFNYSANEILNNHLKMLLPSRSVDMFKDLASEMVKGKSSHERKTLPLPAIKSDGELFNANIYISSFVIHNESFFSLILKDSKNSEPDLEQKSEKGDIDLLDEIKDDTASLSPDSLLSEKVNQMASDFQGKFSNIENVIKDIADYLNPEYKLRNYAARIMVLALNIWENDLNKTKVDLAEDSQIWKAYCDMGTWRTRTLDKYLVMETLPKNPRYRDVLKTAEYVLSKSNIESPEARELEEMINYMAGLLHKGSKKEIRL